MFNTKKFSDRATAYLRMKKQAKEVYNIELPENLDINKTKISLNKRHVYFKANTNYKVWAAEIKGPGKKILLCDISTGNVELIEASNINF